jgi:hypothetical protein
VVCLLYVGFGLMGIVRAIDPTQTQFGGPSSAAPVAPPATGGGAATAAAAATAPSSGIAATLSNLKQYFTVTCDVREEYDDNVYTTNTNKVSSFDEQLTPSILFSYPMENSTFDARYTVGLVYYNHSPSDQHLNQDHDVVLRYNHSFNDRFNLDLRDDGGYHIDPALLNSIGTVTRQGGYYDNIFTAEFTAQWTPLFGTVSSYSNNFVYYENGNTGAGEDSTENTFSQDFRFAFWPTVTFSAGVIYDNIDYFYSDRGYANYTGNVGLDWQALPSVSLGFRVGGSVTELNQGGGSEASPYASANLNWQLGERSRIVASYEHTITPSDITFSQGEESDRITTNFLYNLTERATTHLEGTFSHDVYQSQLIQQASAVGAPSNGFSENVVGFDTGVTYHYNQYLDFEVGYIFSLVDSPISVRDYTRNQIYLGLRGTY